jgi:hypothetical protein
MASRTLPGIGLAGGRASGESGWATEMNANLLKLSVLTQLSVKSRVTALPGSPVDGDIYIVPSGGDANKVAVRDAAAWTYYVPLEGMRAYVQDDDTVVTWNGTSWATLKETFDVTGFFPGKPTASAVVHRTVFTRAATFADDFAGSLCSAGTSATASTTFTIKKNGSNIGTIVFAAAGTAGVFLTTGAGTTIVSGDVLEISGPASADATLANIAFNLLGTR